ncbi:MAG: DIP1984 family protein [Oscillospiraceae bacterium]|nr:DIP1984 family protein [Oscillospiraceae bacterium]
MKLAAALMRRADLQNKINELEIRLLHNARVQEGEKPAEAPAELLEALHETFREHEALVTAINLTNAQSSVDGQTITARIAHRDTLMWKQRVLRGFLNEASILAPRTAKTEIRITSAVDVRKLQKQLDGIAKELRECEEKLQEINWTTELIGL